MVNGPVSKHSVASALTYYYPSLYCQRFFITITSMQLRSSGLLGLQTNKPKSKIAILDVIKLAQLLALPTLCSLSIQIERTLTNI